MNHRNLVEITSTKENTIQFARQHNYLITENYCNKCNILMETVFYEAVRDKYSFYCKFCRTRISIRTNSIISNFNLPLEQFFDILYFYLNFPLTFELCNREIGIKSEKTFIRFRKVMRNIILELVIQNSQKVGGPGVIVQIDETLVYKRKYNLGRLREQIWVIGGICPQFNTYFMQIVPNRNNETIKNVLDRWIIPGTIIYTDEWAAYPRAINRFNEENGSELDSEHFTVNHSQNFVGEGGVNTQAIESFWGTFK